MFKLFLKMKTQSWTFLSGCAISLLVAGAASAQTTTNTFTQTVGQTIPVSTIPLSSTLNISGVSGTISGLQVNLDITGGFNGDLYCYLLDPADNIAILLNRTGLTANNGFGYGDTGFNLTFSDGASNVHNYQAGGDYDLNPDGQLTGTWAPDGRNIDPQSDGSAFDDAPPTYDFSAFMGTIPDGNWELEVANLASGDDAQAVLQSWTVTVFAVPEPQPWALGVCGIAMLAARRYFRRGK